MKIDMKVITTYEYSINLYLVPLVSRPDKSFPDDYVYPDSKTSLKKLFAYLPDGRYPSCWEPGEECGQLFVNIAKIKKCSKKATLTNINIMCPVCKEEIETINIKGTTNPYQYFYAPNTYDDGVEWVSHRFVNINKRSAKFAIPLHSTCREVLNINPLMYLPELEEMAKQFDNENIRLK